MLIKKNNIHIIGEGNEVLFFIHGYGCDQNMWRYITPAFVQQYKIVLIDLVGSGKSDIAVYDFEKYNTLQGYADDVIEICDFFNFKNINLIGHSVSAMIAALVAINRPQLCKNLIMVCPSPCYLNDDGYNGGFALSDIDEMLATMQHNYLGWSSAIAPVIVGNPEKPEYAEELAQSFCRNNPEIAKHFALVTFKGDSRTCLPKITTPTLILQCSNDILAPLEVGNYVSNHIKHSTLKVLKATGHCPHLTTPAETIAAIKHYLDKS